MVSASVWCWIIASGNGVASRPLGPTTPHFTTLIGEYGWAPVLAKDVDDGRPLDGDGSFELNSREGLARPAVATAGRGLFTPCYELCMGS